MINFLLDTWNKLWDGSKIDEVLINKAWKDLVDAYSKKARHYHNLEHIFNMISSSVTYAPKLDDLKTIQLSIFYHDYIYSAKRKDNEEKSAIAAENSLLNLDYPRNLIEKCKQYIISTKSHENLYNSNDLNYLLDFDLEILAAPWPDYEKYTHQIRKEYIFYPDIFYIPGRKKVLEHFLNLPNIYKTSDFSNNYELRARQNLKNELELL